MGIGGDGGDSSKLSCFVGGTGARLLFMPNMGFDLMDGAAPTGRIIVGTVTGVYAIKLFPLHRGSSSIDVVVFFVMSEVNA